MLNLLTQFGFLYNLSEIKGFLQNIICLSQFVRSYGTTDGNAALPY